MKTYLHYIWYVLKSHYKKDPFDIIMPIWLAVSFSLIAIGLGMFMFNASPGNVGALWWLVLAITGIIICPFIIAPIAVWFETRYKNYTAWKKSSSSSDKQTRSE